MKVTESKEISSNARGLSFKSPNIRWVTWCSKKIISFSFGFYVLHKWPISKWRQEFHALWKRLKRKTPREWCIHWQIVYQCTFYSKVIMGSSGDEYRFGDFLRNMCLCVGVCVGGGGYPVNHWNNWQSQFPCLLLKLALNVMVTASWILKTTLK